MDLQNKIMLITYADTLGTNIKDLNYVVDTYYKNAINGIHVLPFFPSSADRGFAPICYDEVEKSFGTISDIKHLGEDYSLMYDFMVNHISKQSTFFKDFLEKKDDSLYKDLFIRYKEFWDNSEPTTQQIDAIYKRKPVAPCIEVEFKDSTKEKIWCTFSTEQVDLNVNSEIGKKFIKDSLISMCENGASIIRLDAFAYAIKKQGTSCFFIEPQMWDLLYEIQNIVKPYGVEILPEIHEHYSIQFKISEKGFWIYDFALPMLVLHGLYSGRADRLKHWIDISPKKQFTTLDTHDGIGVVDVRDLLTDEEIEQTKECMFTKGANVKKIYNTELYNNLDIYQINCTYFSALGNREDSYLLARAIQFFAKGIPMVYYVGLLAGENDIELMETTKNGRDINRHYYSLNEIELLQDQNIVTDIKELMIFRNNHKAFNIEGNCETEVFDTSILIIKRSFENHIAILEADMKNHTFKITYTDNDFNLKSYK